ncbi:hypothetical protein [Mycobacterium sp.]|uniref:hypothetical protein n=1 Tax=Mycobacterium sp. TaxID=1785 RepID=UPI003F986F1E
MLAPLLQLDPDAGEQLSKEIDQSDGTFASITDLLDKRGIDGRIALSALMSLMAAGRRYRIPPESLVSALKESLGIKEQGAGVTALVQNAAVQRFAKALSLRNEYERIITDTRILSDIRPVFDDDAEDPSIQAAIVNHTLRFTYTAGDGERHETHFALDTADLKKLKAQIEKALKKDKSSQRLIENANVVVLEAMEEES